MQLDGGFSLRHCKTVADTPTTTQYKRLTIRSPADLIAVSLRNTLVASSDVLGSSLDLLPALKAKNHRSTHQVYNMHITLAFKPSKPSSALVYDDTELQCERRHHTQRMRFELGEKASDAGTKLGAGAGGGKPRASHSQTACFCPLLLHHTVLPSCRPAEATSQHSVSTLPNLP